MNRDPWASFAHSPDLPGEIYTAFIERARRARMPRNVVPIETARERAEWRAALAALEEYERA
jgi:hypothetical protein